MTSLIQMAYQNLLDALTILLLVNFVGVKELFRLHYMDKVRMSLVPIAYVLISLITTMAFEKFDNVVVKDVSQFVANMKPILLYLFASMYIGRLDFKLILKMLITYASIFIFASLTIMTINLIVVFNPVTINIFGFVMTTLMFILAIVFNIVVNNRKVKV